MATNITLTGDITHQLQDAVNQSAGTPISLGPGRASLSAAILVPSHCKIVGAGPSASILVPQNGVNAFTVRVPGEDYSTIFEDFQVHYPQPQPWGTSAAFSVGASTQEHTGFRLRRCKILNAQIGVGTINASLFVIDDLTCLDVANTCVLVQNTNGADSGDSTIVNSCFSNYGNPVQNGLGVQQLSSGGLRICNTKFNQFNQAYQLALAAGAETSDLLINGCSMEAIGFQGMEGAAVFCYHQGAGKFRNIVISGCQIAGYKRTIDIADQASGWLTKVSAGGNNVLTP